MRPIRPEDEGMLVAFHGRLGDSSVRERYLAPLRLDERTTHERLIRVCFSDYDRDIALVVEHRARGGEAELLAVGRLARRSLRRLVDIARQEQIPRVTAKMLPDNHAMMQIVSRLGFALRCAPGDPEASAVLELSP